ncbi:delta-lactam-biosynthetic de-N-acetylase [Paenibacillus piri]|uniref:Xylanase deacetylase n=1 Tax=Paenibacillus piri TaxID=2547395 RepID=A0A4V2ZT58_9BACL|nr:polysaccharide deacetylase family protein [Paenibacillus piri]TDF95804.1 xylanase deacetylase [Paenibacillus piri]
MKLSKMTGAAAGITLAIGLAALTSCSSAAPANSPAAAAESSRSAEKSAPEATKPTAPEASTAPHEPAASPAAKPVDPPPVPVKDDAPQSDSSQAANSPAAQGAAATATSATYKADGSSGAKDAAASSRKALSWYYMKQSKGKVPNFPNETKQYTDRMKALWVGTGKKVYLTIDTGGPLGDMDLLVKSLKDNNAKANFFIAGYNVKKAPDFIRTLVKDGHLVANHTMTHTDMNLQSDEQVKKEIKDYELLYKEVTGKDIQPYFRFPYGRYNMHLLNMVSDMGYTSVFWSTAMKDWEPRKNGAEDPYNDIMNNLHDGNIILMHQGSPENIEALDRIIKGVREAGYEFALLTDIKPPAR